MHLENGNNRVQQHGTIAGLSLALVGSGLKRGKS
jgi:hypothetical protein